MKCLCIFKNYPHARLVCKRSIRSYWQQAVQHWNFSDATLSRPCSTAEHWTMAYKRSLTAKSPTLEKLESITYVYTCCMKYCMRVQPHTYCIYVYTYIYIYINAVGYSLAPKAMLTQNIAGVRPFSTRHHIHAKASYVRMCMPGVLRQNIVAVRLCSTRHGYSHPDRSWR